MKVNQLNLEDIEKSCCQAIGYCRDRPPDQLLLLNFVLNGHSLDLSIPSYGTLPNGVTFFIMHVIYNPTQPTAVVHILQHPQRSFTKCTVTFGKDE
jgi:hypothetical protein